MLNICYFLGMFCRYDEITRVCFHVDVLILSVRSFKMLGLWASEEFWQRKASLYIGAEQTSCGAT